MSKIINDGLTRSGRGALQLYRYVNSGRQNGKGCEENLAGRQHGPEHITIH